MSYVVERKGGKRKVTFYGKAIDGKSNVITSKEISEKDAKEMYGSGSSSNRNFALVSAAEYNKSLPSREQAQTSTETFTDQSGRVLTPYEVGGLKATSGAQSTNEGTVYNSLSIAKPKAMPVKKDSYSNYDLGGTIRASDKKSSFYGTGVGRFVSSVKSSFGGVNERNLDFARSDVKGAFPERAGVVFGSVGSVASFSVVGSKVPMAVKGFGSLSAPVITRYSSALSKVPEGGRFVTNAVIGVGTGLGISRGVYEVGKSSLNSDYKKFFGSKGNVGVVEEAYKSGMSESLLGKSKAVKFVSDIPVADKFVSDNYSFEKGVRKYAGEQGIYGAEQENLVIASGKYANIRRVSFAAGLVSANTFSEVGGQVAFGTAKTVSFAKDKAVKGLFFKGGSTIFKQGLIEGASSVVSEQAASGRTIRTLNYKDISLGAFTGGASAGVIGGTIIASQGSRSVGGKVLGKTVSGVSNVIDPYESIGDAIADTGSFRSGSIIKRPKTTVLSGSMGGSKSNVFSSPERSNVFSSTKSSIKGVKFSSNSFTNTRSLSRTNVNSFAQTNTKSFINTNTNINSFARTNVLARTSVNTRTNINVRTNVPVKTSVTTRTNTNTNVFAGGFPLMDISLGGMGGGFYRSSNYFKQGKEYTPSLSAAVLGISGGAPSKGLLKTGLVVRPL
jgi:hypothetical protein